MTTTTDEQATREHPSQLALERYLHHANDSAELDAIEAHVQRCQTCRTQLDAMRDFDATWPKDLPTELDTLLGGAVPLTLEAGHGAAPPARRSAPSTAHTTSRRAATSLLLLAAACLAIFVLLGDPSSLLHSTADDVPRLTDPSRQSQPDVIRRKAANFRLDVFIHNGEKARLAIDGEQVYPGERVGFQISAAQAGYLLIAGQDEASNTYLGYPQDREGAASRLEVNGAPGPIKLDQALLLDDVLGTEKLVAMYCPDTFSFEDLEPLLTRDTTPPSLTLENGCVVQTLTLQKIASPGQRDTP